MQLSAILLIIAISCTVAYLLTGLLIRILSSHKIFDVPNARSAHQVPTPRGGGIGIIAGLCGGLFVAYLYGLPIPHLPLIAGVLMVAIAGLLDDCLFGIPIVIRLGVQLIAATFIAISSGGLTRLPFPEPLNLPVPDYVAQCLAVIWIVAVANIYNFLDGIDGYAGLQGVLAGIGLALLGEEMLMVAGLAIAGACFGFLMHNWHPARIFMGDVGSATLGFLFAALPFELLPEIRSKSVFILSIFLWFFLADGFATLITRLLQHEKFWLPHRRHLYQRLHITGVNQNIFVCWMGSVSLVFVLAAGLVWKSHSSALEWALLGLAVVAFLIYAQTVRVIEAGSVTHKPPSLESNLQITRSLH